MELALLGFALILFLSFLGIPLAFSTLMVAIGGYAYARGDLNAAWLMSGQELFEFTTNFNLSVIPVFILMGSLIQKANISNDLYEAGYAWVGRRRGGLAMATVLSCAGFSAVCGSSLATAATMAKVAMPPMRKYGYDDSLSTGTLAAGGTLGIMIPPSVPMIIYGIATETDIGALFIAGILPGAVLVGTYLVAIYIRVTISPESGPKGDIVSIDEKMRTVYRSWPIFVLFALVLGSIYLGWATPTEAGSVGAIGAYMFALSRGRMMNLRDNLDVFADAIMTTAMIFAIGFAANAFGQFLNLVGLSQALVDFTQSFHLGQIGLVLLISVICVLLGMVFESIGILLLIIPVFVPSLLAVGVDMVWFGIIVIIVVELGLITPPIGINVFTVKTMVPDVPLAKIFKGVVPFVFADLAALIIIVLIPSIATFLPSLMK
ncbi:MAG: TRAP transporter large permease [Rhodospirillales bacterium]|nr:TRAP transporter large permease [Rhodospirillales bacterium]